MVTISWNSKVQDIALSKWFIHDPLLIGEVEYLIYPFPKAIGELIQESIKLTHKPDFVLVLDGEIVDDCEVRNNPQTRCIFYRIDENDKPRVIHYSNGAVRLHNTISAFDTGMNPVFIKQ